MEQVELYDVVERAYAGFSQIVQDCFHGWTPESLPYWKQMQAAPMHTLNVKRVAKDWTGKQDEFDLPEWLLCVYPYIEFVAVSHQL